MRDLLVLTLLLLTAACSATMGGAPRAPEYAAVPPDPVLPQPVPRPEAAPGPAPVPEPRPPGHRVVEPFDLEQLGGATQSAVIAMIGPPDEERDQPPGKVWVYRQDDCQIEVHMYPSVDVGSMAVLGTAIRPATLADDERERCRRRLARRTAAKSG